MHATARRRRVRQSNVRSDAMAEERQDPLWHALAGRGQTAA